MRNFTPHCIKPEGPPDMDCISTPAFNPCIGIDYSGAQTPASSLKSLRIYMADRASPPVEVISPPGPRKYWTRIQYYDQHHLRYD
jgi:hypothetical protein